jgi:predicted RNA-binding Zn ribbon-like protein
MLEEHRFIGGCLSLNFVMTMTGRYHTPGGREWLVAPEDLGRWFAVAGLVAEPPPVRPGELVQARQLREAVYRLVRPDLRATPRQADIDVLNACASHGGLRRMLGEDARSVRLHGKHLTRSCLGEVATDAIGLLAGPLLVNVRECAQDGCSLLFLDTSRARQRRWCDMARCGNRSKAARHRRQSREERDEPRRIPDRRPPSTGGRYVAAR